MAYLDRNPSTTKAGPGRRHVSGHKRATPVASKGAPMGFVQHTNPAKNALRKAKASFGGNRQYRIACRAAAAAEAA